MARLQTVNLGDDGNFNESQSFQDVRPSLLIDSNDERLDVHLLGNDSENEYLDQLNLSSNQNGVMDNLTIESRTTDDQSMMSASERVEITSPGPEIGSWMENEYRRRLPTEYHFLQTPLRLSPQYEHCRGSPGLHDALIFLERWNEY